MLSSQDTLNAFAQFCHDVEKDDYFAANMKMRAASIKLNEAEESLAEIQAILKTDKK